MNKFISMNVWTLFNNRSIANFMWSLVILGALVITEVIFSICWVDISKQVLFSHAISKWNSQFLITVLYIVDRKLGHRKGSFCNNLISRQLRVSRMFNLVSSLSIVYVFFSFTAFKKEKNIFTKKHFARKVLLLLDNLESS